MVISLSRDFAIKEGRKTLIKEGNIAESEEKIEGQRKIILMGSCNTT